MSARPEDIARIDAWLGIERSAEDVLAQLRDLLCDVVWAGDDLCEAAESDSTNDPQYAQAWRQIGGQAALDRLDALAGDLTDILKVTR